MRTLLFAFAAVAAASAFSVGPTHAQNYAFCLKNSPGPGDCRYNTYEQCLASASGINGYCQPNYAFSEREAEQGYGHSRASHAHYSSQY
jgi:hypothetical protein